MCPFCLSTAALIFVGSVSGGGLAALAVKVSRKKNDTSDFTTDPRDRSPDVNQQG